MLYEIFYMFFTHYSAGKISSSICIQDIVKLELHYQINLVRLTNYIITRFLYQICLTDKSDENNIFICLRHSLKSGPETRAWDPETWDPKPWDSETRDSRTRDSGTLGHGTWLPGPWKWVPVTWKLQLWDPEAWEQDPEHWNCDADSKYPTLTTDWINFNCEANFDNKKLGHLDLTQVLE